MSPVRNLQAYYIAQCVHRIGAPLGGRSAAPQKGCGYSPLALRLIISGKFLTG